MTPSLPDQNFSDFSRHIGPETISAWSSFAFSWKFPSLLVGVIRSFWPILRDPFPTRLSSESIGRSIPFGRTKDPHRSVCAAYDPTSGPTKASRCVDLLRRDVFGLVCIPERGDGLSHVPRKPSLWPQRRYQSLGCWHRSWTNANVLPDINLLAAKVCQHVRRQVRSQSDTHSKILTKVPEL